VLTTRDARAEIDDVTCAVQPNNSMRFDCVIRMVGNGRVKLGHRRVVDSDWTWVASTDSLPLHGLTVYGVVPGETYSYRVEDLDDGDAVQALLPIPSLPAGLQTLDLSATGVAKSRYVLFDTEGCDDNQYLVLWDTVRDAITWYLDVHEETGGADISGFNVVRSLTDPLQRSILLMLDQRNVYEFNWSGKPLAVYGSSGSLDPWPGCEVGMDGPCPHHDVTRDDGGHMWAVAARTDTEVPITAPEWATCPPSESYLDDGLMEIVGGAVVDDDWMMDELVHDPVLYPGPDPGPAPLGRVGCDYLDYLVQLGRSDLLDWTHVNSIDRVPGSEGGLLLSVAEHGEIVRYDAAWDVVLWGVATDGRPTDLAVSLHPSRTFNFGADYAPVDRVRWDFQHDVHDAAAGTIDFFDNHKAWGAQSRVVKLRVEDPNAYIMASWNFPFDGANPEKYACNSRGSARLVPGTAVPSSDPGTVPHYYGVMLAMCAKTKSVVELVADDGSPAPLGYELTVAPTACLLDPNRVDNGWHRAYPIMSLGQQ